MDIETHNELETKAGIPLDAVVTHTEMMRAFEAFKETNDQRLALAGKNSGDIVVEEKLARIDSAITNHARRLDDIALKGARPALSGERAAVRRGAKVMKSSSPPDMSVDQLVRRFADLCIAQDQALLASEAVELNQLIREMCAIQDELELRAGDQRHALVALYEN